MNKASNSNGNEIKGPGAPLANKNALKPGLHHYKAMLNGDGLDQGSGLFRAFHAKEQELVTALGSDPSPQQQAIIADAIKNMLYVSSLDNYLKCLKSIVRKGKAHPVLSIRTQLAAHLREDLKTLSIHRRVRMQSLNEILAAQGDDNPDGKAD